MTVILRGYEMVNVQNEIKYRIAYSMLKKLLDDNLLKDDEFDIAHKVILNRFSPEAVCRLP